MCLIDEVLTPDPKLNIINKPNNIKKVKRVFKCKFKKSYTKNIYKIKP